MPPTFPFLWSHAARVGLALPDQLSHPYPTPPQGGATVAGSTLFMLIHNPGTYNSDTLLIGDLAAQPPTFRTLPVGDLLSCCPFGIGALGGALAV